MAKSKFELKSHRATQLVDLLRQAGGSARTSCLAQSMDVSEETVRRIAKRLEKDGSLTRAHGGLTLNDRPVLADFQQRVTENVTSKRKIAAAIAALVPDGAALFLDTSSTATFVAEALHARAKLFVVTNSLNIAALLAKHNENRVFLAGGEVTMKNCGTFSAGALSFVSGFATDFAVLSPDAVALGRGAMLLDPAEADIARAVLARSRVPILAADRSKLGRFAPALVAPLSQYRMFVTDAPPPAPFQAALRAGAVDLLVAGAAEAAPLVRGVA